MVLARPTAVVRYGQTIHTPQNRPHIHSLANGRLHKSRQRREHVDGRIDLPVVDLPVDVDLTLRNVARQIRDRMGDVIVGHSQDGDLSNGTCAQEGYGSKDNQLKGAAGYRFGPPHDQHAHRSC